MPELLQLFILLPLFAFLLSLLIPAKKEKPLSFLAIGATGLYLAAILGFTIYWLANGHPLLDRKHVVIYQDSRFEFFIDFLFDKTTAVFAITGGLLIFLVAVFSRFYLHRDEGFKRFFTTLLLFFVGYNLVIFSGNFETLFIGWEVLGFCSFLLIAFYRDRYLPIKNGLKVLSVYRLGDICLVLAMWMSHHVFLKNITFVELSGGLVAGSASGYISFICIMVIVAAAAKSAMFPFSSWLPRAMEGPTTSSAVFYGSLSVHLGAFLLIRTYPLWQGSTGITILIGALGLFTSLLATSVARVQSTVKTQVAYASVTQIGLIFAEIALGFHTIALIHFAANACLRTYQLLVSPSVLGYKIHDMFFNYQAPKERTDPQWLKKLKHAIYISSIKEWNLDRIMYQFLWSPFKWVGKNMSFVSAKGSITFIVLIFSFGLYSFVETDTTHEHMDAGLANVASVIGLLMVLAGFSSRGNARAAWLYVVAGQFFVTLSIALNAEVPVHQLVIYLAPLVAGGITGYACLQSVHHIDQDISLNRFHGYNYEKPYTGFAFLLSALILIGFPITPAFLGIDLLFTHIHADQPLLATLSALSFIFIELAIIRIYGRIFLGQHKKNYHPIAYRSS